jgi:PIN domain nuclease of toxin-antitoxin system
MKLLLDTQIFLLLIDRRTADLPSGIAALLSDTKHEHFLSAASLWEIGIKWRLGKLGLKPSLSALPELIQGLGIKVMAIDEHHALAAVEAEPPTRDPFDRMLLAQCRIEGLRLVTIDRALRSHPLAAPS